MRSQRGKDMSAVFVRTAFVKVFSMLGAKLDDL
jgi:hypothetical protein